MYSFLYNIRKWENATKKFAHYQKVVFSNSKNNYSKKGNFYFNENIGQIISKKVVPYLITDQPVIFKWFKRSTDHF